MRGDVVGATCVLRCCFRVSGKVYSSCRSLDRLELNPIRWGMSYRLGSAARPAVGFRGWVRPYTVYAQPAEVWWDIPDPFTPLWIKGAFD